MGICLFDYLAREGQGERGEGEKGRKGEGEREQRKRGIKETEMETNKELIPNQRNEISICV